MKNQLLDEASKVLIYLPKIRCNSCYEIPTIKELVNGGGISYYISAECPNKHGVMFSTLQDFCSDKNQIDKIKCHQCNNFQGKVDAPNKLFEYCKECRKFLCQDCQIKHNKKNKNHHTTNIKVLDFLCKEHNLGYSAFCSKCNVNLCNFCYQRNHAKHEKIYKFNEIKPSVQKVKEASKKIAAQKSQVDEINKILNKILNSLNKVKEYQDNLNSILKFNNQVFNCFDEQKMNYQSIVNFDKIIDIDISGDIGWIVDLKENIDKFIDFIKSKAPTNKQVQNEKLQNATKNIDKDLFNTFQESIVAKEKSNATSIDVLETISKEKIDDFTDNELLKEIGKKNKKVIKKDEIIGQLKDIYILDECKDYLILADNGIFIYDQLSNDLINYIDVNDNLEYDEVISLTYFYNKKQNKIYLFLGTNTNKVKIYCIDQNKEYTYELIQEIKLEKIKNMFCNKNGDLLILEEESYSTFSFDGERFEQEKEYINEEKETKNLYITENYLIFAIKEKEEILFYDKNNFGQLFSVDKVNNDDNSKIFEMSKSTVCVSFKDKIQIIDVDSKKLSSSYDNIKMDYIECVDLINEKEILLSSNLNNNHTAFILVWDDSKKSFNEKKKLEDLQCKIVRRIIQNKIILFTRYGVNVIEI